MSDLLDVQIALRTRGFLSFIKEGEMLLVRGSCEEDIEDLQALGFDVNRLNILHSPQFLAKLEVKTGVGIDKLCRDIVRMGRRGGGFTAVPHWAKRDIRRTVFGAKIPVRYLEPGIALMVKVMPMLRIGTSMSCDGHLKKNPKIWVVNQQVLDRSRLVFAELNDLVTANALNLEFDDRDPWGPFSYSIEFSTTEGDLSSCQRGLRLLATALLDDPQRCADIRTIKDPVRK